MEKTGGEEVGISENHGVWIMKSFFVAWKMGVEPKIGVWCLPPKMDGLYIMRNPIKMDDLGGVKPLFLETPR